MSDVTAQEFRKAAAIAKRDGDAAFAGLFLAAAEQREQLDAIKEQIDGARGEVDRGDR